MTNNPLKNTFSEEEDNIISGTDAQYKVGDQVIVCSSEDRYGDNEYLHGTVTECLGKETQYVRGLAEMLMDNPPLRPEDRVVGEHKYQVSGSGRWEESQIVLASDVTLKPEAFGLDKLDSFDPHPDSEQHREYFQLVGEIHITLGKTNASLGRELGVHHFLRKLEKQLDGV